MATLWLVPLGVGACGAALLAGAVRRLARQVVELERAVAQAERHVPAAGGRLL